MAIRKMHTNNVTVNRADIATQYDDIFFDDQANSLLLPDPSGLLEMKIGAGSVAGAMNYKQYVPTSTVTLNAIGQTVMSTTFTSSGNPVLVIANGDANPLNGGSWTKLQWYRNGTPIGVPIHTESGQSNVNVTYAVVAIDTPPAGTNTYTLQTVTAFGPNAFQFGESTPPVAEFIELVGAQGPQGVGIKGFASGYVNAGTFVTLDNVKVSVTTSGNRGLCMATVSGTMTCSIAGHYMYSYSGPSGTATTYPGANYTTTPSGSFFGWSFGNAGDTSIYMINDYTNQRFYRVTLMIGAAYNNNFISIERLY
jgi:hypothetical protein